MLDPFRQLTLHALSYTGLINANDRYSGSKKPKAKGATPMAGGFANWMMGGRNPPRVNKAPKAEKKAEPAAQ